MGRRADGSILEWVDLWPGCRRFLDGRGWQGPLTAVAFAVLLNLWLSFALIWRDWATQGAIWGIGVLAVAFWGVGWIESRRFRSNSRRANEQDRHLDLFLAARAEYLQGNGRACEQALHRLLQQSPDDVEARLLYATLLRHRGQIDLAREQLRRLQRWRNAGRWNREIRREWELLARRESEGRANDKDYCKDGLVVNQSITSDSDGNQAA